MIFESKEAFAQSFKAKNPDYKNVPDSMLADKLLAKFPQYESQINPSFRERVQSQTKDLGIKDLAVGAFQGVKEGFQEAGERIGTRKGLIEDMPSETLGQKAKKLGATGLNVLQSGLDVVARPVIGAAEGAVAPVLSPLLSEAFKELPQGVQDEVKEKMTMGADWFNSLSPMAQENLRSVGLGAEAIPGGFVAKKGVSAGTKAVKEGVEAVQGAPRLASQALEVASEVIPEVKTQISQARQNRIIKNNVNELTKLQENNAPLRRVINKIEGEGFDVKNQLAQTDLLRGIVDSDGTIRSQEAIIKLNEAIEPAEDVVYKNLLNETKTIPLDQLRDRMKKDVMNSGVKGGALKRALNAIDDEIEGYAIEAVDVNGTPSLPLAVIHEAKVDKYGNINYLNPETKKIDKRIARTLKEIVEEEATTIDVKQVNNELKKFYSMQNVLEALDGKKVKGGRLGKYTAQVIGATIGSQFGALGALAGAELGNIIKGLQMGGTFSGKVTKPLQRGKVLDEAIESAQSKSLGNRNTAQSMQTITDKTSIKDVSNQPEVTTEIRETQVNNMIPDSALIGKLTDSQRKRFNAGTPAEQERALETLRLKYALENNIEYDPDKVSDVKGWSNVEDFNKVGSTESATLYHGTTTGNIFDKFDPLKVKTGLGNNIANEGDAFYFTKDPKTAKVISYLANEKEAIKRVDPKTLQVPELGYGEVLEFKLDPKAKIKVLDKKPTQAEIAELKKQGYDGVEVPDREVYESTLEGRGKLFDELGDTNTVAIWNTDKVVRGGATSESALLRKSSSFEEKVKTYINESKKQKGTLIIDSDKVKESMEGYTPDKAPEFHEESSKIATQAFKDALKDDSYTDVEFMAGGSGSGKSEVYVNANKNKPSTILFDGTFADKKKAVQKLEEAFASGKNVSIKAIYAPIQDAWEFAGLRDRFVPKDVFIEKHTGFRNTIADLAKEYPDLRIDVYLNRLGKKAVKLKFSSRKALLNYLNNQRLLDSEVSDFLR